MHLIQRKDSTKIFRFSMRSFDIIIFFRRCTKDYFFFKEISIHQWYQFNENDRKNATIITISPAPSFLITASEKPVSPRKSAAASSRFDYTFCDAYIFNYRLSTGTWFRPFANWLQDPRRCKFVILMVQRINGLNGLDLSRNIIMIDTLF